MTMSLRLTMAAMVLAAFDLTAATLYVSLESTNPTPPFATWATAATNIQDGVDAARTGDTVLVTNGLYATGERDGSRVAITNSIRLESANGPLMTCIEGTIIFGNWGYPTGGVSCVVLTASAILSGFTLTNGFSWQGGGVRCSFTSACVVTNCILTGNWNGAYGGNLKNCILTGNQAESGGGACFCTLKDCTLTENIAYYGGGAYYCLLDNCILVGNNVISLQDGGGGGALDCFLTNCTVATNGALSGPGGGAWRSTLYNCSLTGNSAGFGTGAGAHESILYHCTLKGNSGSSTGDFHDCTIAENQGGISGTAYNCLITGNAGPFYGSFFNCTIVENQRGISGTAYNSIVYYNSQGNYSGETTLNYCCTAPPPTNGVGNITGQPLFMDLAAGDFRLWEGSPCIDAGMNLVGVPMLPYEPTDILGNTRFLDGNGDGIVAWDMGAYEFNSFRPPRFMAPPRCTRWGWVLNITGEPNKWTQVQRSSDLSHWGGFLSALMPPDGIMEVTDPETNRMMFYRAVVQ